MIWNMNTLKNHKLTAFYYQGLEGVPPPSEWDMVDLSSQTLLQK